jgi:NAD(P)H-dependent flavin oxidoreductase YrpB (nitropropane dioxygenase family)
MNRFQGNTFTRDFGIRLPIVQGPMGAVAGPELVAAVSNAGGLGVLPVWTLPADRVADEVGRTRSLTTRPFGANFRADLEQTDHIRAALEAGVSIIHLFWGDPGPSMELVRRAGVKMMATVGDAQAARMAVDAGADALIAQGVEAGGHVLSEIPLRTLLEQVLAVAREVSVIAAGGLVDAEDVKEMLSLGAAGVLLGSRFVTTDESLAHDEYKQALVEAGEGATARSECFEIDWPDAPHRHLKNATFTAWDAAGRPGPGARPGEGDVVLRAGADEIPRYSVMPPQRGMTGDIRGAVLYAGSGVGRIHSCAPAADVVSELASLL